MAIVIRDSKCADAGALAAIAVAAWRPIRRRQAEALGAQQFSLQHRDWEEAKAAKVREACAPNFAGSVLVATAADSGVAVGFVSFGEFVPVGQGAEQRYRLSRVTLEEGGCGCEKKLMVNSQPREHKAAAPKGQQSQHE